MPKKKTAPEEKAPAREVDWSSAPNDKRQRQNKLVTLSHADLATLTEMNARLGLKSESKVISVALRGLRFLTQAELDVVLAEVAEETEAAKLAKR
jgi:hypothetical protein